MQDGTQLAYALWLPTGPGPFPCILEYDPYVGGSARNVLATAGWDAAGYALLGVNVRGTGCSSGVFQPLNSAVMGHDGSQIVDWIAAQTWSNGRVGMAGGSYAAITQIATAAFSGAALKAIAPFSVGSDLYRDFVYPGGIYNAAWVQTWGLTTQQQSSDQAANPADPLCMLHRAQSAPGNAAANMALHAPQHPYLDRYYAKQPANYLHCIRIPVLAATTWQDPIMSSREMVTSLSELDPDLTWWIVGNGLHVRCYAPDGIVMQFFDRYLKGLDNGFEAQPHLQLAHEVGHEPLLFRGPAGHHSGAPRWLSGLANWQEAVRPLSLYLRAGGELALSAAPRSQAEVSEYRYPAPSSNTHFTWTTPPSPDSLLRFTTPALAQDLELLGPASLDLWLASTATDTDVQVTLSEVRPDGQEIYVQQGWLRLSHRQLDPARSTPLRPYHTHRQEDATLLTPGQPTFARIEVRPFNHVFRAGSALRLSLDTPSGLAYLPTPATQTVYHDAAHPSLLRCGWRVDGKAQAPLPAADALAGQPCRPNLQALPQGLLRIVDDRPQPDPVAPPPQRSRAHALVSRLWPARKRSA